MAQFLEAAPAFAVSDLEKSIGFYRTKCGYQTIAQGPNFALLTRDGVPLHLWVAGDESWRERKERIPIVSGAKSFLAGTVSCRIQAEGIAELYDTMKAHAIVHPNGSLKRAPYPAYEFVILDPVGNLITFFEMDENS